MAKPVVETRRSDARIIAGSEALIVQLDAEVECVRISGDLTFVSGRAFGDRYQSKSIS